MKSEQNAADETERVHVPVLDGLGFPTLVTDADGRVTRLNPHARELFGADPDAAVGRPPEALLGDGSEVSAVARDAIDSGTPVTDREELFVVVGREIHVSRTVTPVFDDEGGCLGAVEIDRDIGDRIERRERTEALETYQQDVLRDLQGKLSKLAAGDLTIDPSIDPPDADFAEVQSTYAEFTDMNDDLREVVTNFTGVIETLTAQAEEIAASSDGLSASSEEVTASIQEIDASADEMARGAASLADDTETTEATVDDLSASIEEITASTQEMSARSSEAAGLTDDGVRSIRDALGEIRTATTAADGVADEMDHLERHMQEVGEIVEIISDIADQTNILALNANIEAARADSGGEGFAVVANEVKNLAEQSQESADDIVDIIDEAQGMTERLVTSIQDANTRVGSGADAVDESADTIGRIRDNIDGTNRGIGEIADAVESQARDAERVSTVADGTASVAQQVSATVEEIAAGIDEQTHSMDQVAHRAQHLSEVSDDLHELVDTFRLTKDESAAVDDVEEIAEAQVSELASESKGQLARGGPEPGRPDAGDERDSGPTTLSPDDF